jgi:hypothetical protein
MELNELRIGNIFMMGSYQHTMDYGDYMILAVNSDIPINGIPITEEKLLQLGFKYNESIKHWFINWGINGVEFIKFDEHYSLFSFQLGTGKYKVLEHIHQLQNLYFALTGEELVLTDK